MGRCCVREYVYSKTADLDEERKREKEREGERGRGEHVKYQE